MSGVKSRLSIMMFLQYAIWGAWLPILWPFLAGYRHMESGQIGNMFVAGGVGAILGPFLAGQLADRTIATERLLGLCHLLGAVLMWFLASIDTYLGFLVASLLYSVIYMPTLPLTNSLSFHHLADRDRDFGKVRVWGTIGWIVAGIVVGQWLHHVHTPETVPEKTAAWVEFAGTPAGRAALRELDHARPGQAREIEGILDALDADDSPTGRATATATLLLTAPLNEAGLRHGLEAAWNAGRADAFRMAALLGVLLGVFCFFLPHTPPSKGEKNFAAAEAMQRIRVNPLLTLFLLSVPVSCIHQFYFVHTSTFLTQFDLGTRWIDQVFGVGGSGLMTIGQMWEMAVLCVIPLFVKRFPRKVFLAIGLLAYAARMAAFSYAGQLAEMGIHPAITVITGIAMHGLCFGCFIFVAFMIVDEETSPDVRATAQNLFNLVIVGIGIIVGSKIADQVHSWATTDGVTDYAKLFSVPMWAALGCLVLLGLFYPSRRPADAAPK